MTNFQLIDHYRKDFAVFSQFIGHPLQSLARDQFLFNGNPQGEDNCSLEIRFADDSVITLSTASDGVSVGAAVEALTIQELITMDDGSQCETRLVELTTTKPWSTLLANPLTEVQAMVDHWPSHEQLEKYVSGWLLWFGNSFIGYYNFGDDGKVIFNPKARTRDHVATTYECVAGENAV